MDADGIIEPRPVMSDAYALGALARSWFDGLTSPLRQLAAGVSRAIDSFGPVMADAVATRKRPGKSQTRVSVPSAKIRKDLCDTSASAKVTYAENVCPGHKTVTLGRSQGLRHETLAQALKKVRIEYKVEAGHEGGASSPAALARLKEIRLNLRQEILKATRDGPEIELMIKEGLQNIDGIEITLPEFAPDFANWMVKDKFARGVFWEATNVVYIGHLFDGKHCADTIIHEFSHVREFHFPETRKLPEYDSDKISACFGKFWPLYNATLFCIADQNPRSAECMEVLPLEPFFRTRTAKYPCFKANAVHSERTDDHARHVGVTVPKRDGKDENVMIFYDEFGTGKLCIAEPYTVTRNGVHLPPMTPWQKLVAKMYWTMNDYYTRDMIAASYSPEEFGDEYHAFFAQYLPRGLTGKMCPEMFPDASAGAKSAIQTPPPEQEL